MSVLRHVVTTDKKHYGYTFRCPGCEVEHTIPTEPYPDGWTFDGNETAPTFNPSIHVYPSKTLDDNGNVIDTPRCHSFVRGGKIQFLNDSTHALAGQTVPLPELPGTCTAS